MLKHSRVSRYKIKKILRCFVNDYTAVESQKHVKLNIRTIERYYNIFKEIINVIAGELIIKYGTDVTYIGYVQGFYCERKFLDIFRYGERLYLANVLNKEPKHNKLALQDDAFSTFSTFFYKRAKKFYGFSKKSYYNQIIEYPIRWYFNDSEKLYNVIYKKL